MGPLGGLLGFFLGSAIETYIGMSRQLPGGDSSSETYTGRGYNRTGGSASRGGYTATEQRNSFLVSLLVLSAAVIKADGKTLQSELDYVKDFVRRNFGEAAVPEAMRMLEQLCRQDVNIYTVGPQIARYMNYSQRLQNSVIAMFYKETSSAYTVLEISPGASDDEVRTAYRKMAMKNHPDKVATLGPDVQKAAAEKFRQVQEAYEAIKKERGMS